MGPQKDVEITPWKMRVSTIFIHELRSIRNFTSERSERVIFFFFDTPQRVNKNRSKHFPLCNLFISLVLCFTSCHNYKQASLKVNEAT